MKSRPTEKTHSSLSETRQRILRAAAAAFGRDGMVGATTREIAREAGVNEVTLFRHFQSKERLHAAVVEHVREQQAELLATLSPAGAGDLHAKLARLGKLYEELLIQNMPFFRTLMSEMPRMNTRTDTCKEVFAPVRRELIETIEAEQKAGTVRADVNAALAADVFRGMIFTGVLRKDLSLVQEDYTLDEYCEGSIDLFIRGIATAQIEGAPK